MNNARSIAFWLVLFLLILALFNLISGGQTNTTSSTVSYSDFVQRVEGGDVSNATIDGERIVFRSSDGRDYVTPDDVRSVVHSILRHRLILTYDALADHITPDAIIDEIVLQVAVG